ncbi:hypothetical protein [Microbacterium sp. SLBN-146]|uniref:hypothetical protein n=1 Tax=Microbacterium sp. SLBN-146 TaxID=2768457 RepID=UPI001151B9B2|nr:hypothetical protein [Microbacterium sp. SLBN-146]TQJ31278.1 hypothetical protein FBY39_1742 [Microbacterium sp. SLBN-146]
MKRAAVASLSVILMLLAGCSQIEAIAPVGGDRLAEVRFAGFDVLVDEGVDIRTAPVCTDTDGTVACAGDTLDGTTIRITSTSDAPDALIVVVGDETLYDGSLHDVLEKAMAGR